MPPVVQENRQARRARGSSAPPAAVAEAAIDPFGPDVMRGMLSRLGLIALAVWIIGGCVAGFSRSTTTITIALAVPGVVTLGLVGLFVWAMRRARTARGVAGILREARSSDDKKRAIEQLDRDFKKGDAAAIFAKAQLQLEEDPRAALETLEKIDLKKAMATVADEARGQRGMIHLLLGDVSQARVLCDEIDLSRHQDSRSKALLASVIAEAWSRSGQAKKALGVIEPFNPEDEHFAQLKPQIYRARAFVYAYNDNLPEMKRALHKLVGIDVRTLGGFMGKKTHPLLQKEAKRAMERSGQLPRRMQIERR
jgi:hypothetical protein